MNDSWKRVCGLSTRTMDSEVGWAIFEDAQDNPLRCCKKIENIYLHLFLSYLSCVWFSMCTLSAIQRYTICKSIINIFWKRLFLFLFFDLRYIQCKNCRLFILQLSSHWIILRWQEYSLVYIWGRFLGDNWMVVKSDKDACQRCCISELK